MVKKSGLKLGKKWMYSPVFNPWSACPDVGPDFGHIFARFGQMLSRCWLDLVRCWIDFDQMLVRFCSDVDNILTLLHGRKNADLHFHRDGETL